MANSFIYTLSNQSNIPLVIFGTICILRYVLKDLYTCLSSPYSYADIFYFYYSVPILLLPVLSWVHYWLQRQRKLSIIYDVREKPLRCKLQSQLPPFLPVKKKGGNDSNDNSSEWEKVYKTLCASAGRRKKAQEVPTRGWALVTGASRGIGRALAVELARYQMPVILVARNHSQLLDLSKMLEECYGIPTMIFVSDFSIHDAAEKLWKEIQNVKIKDKALQIDVLIHNAGIGDTNNLVDMDTKTIQNIITVNTITVSKLCQILGKEMKVRKQGRIVLISSIAGVAPGVPTAAMYAATKAFQKSLAVSMGLELEAYGVGVTNIMPGAVYDTDFGIHSNMPEATIWKLPFGRLTSSIVATSTITAMIHGSPEVVVGWFNVLSCRFMFLLMPQRLVAIVCGLMWNPPPFFSKEKTK